MASLHTPTPTANSKLHIYIYVAVPLFGIIRYMVLRWTSSLAYKPCITPQRSLFDSDTYKVNTNYLFTL